MESQGIPNSQSNPKKKNKTKEFTLPGIKTNYKITAIKTVWCWHKGSKRTVDDKHKFWRKYKNNCWKDCRGTKSR